MDFPDHTRVRCRYIFIRGAGVIQAQELAFTRANGTRWCRHQPWWFTSDWKCSRAEGKEQRTRGFAGVGEKKTSRRLLTVLLACQAQLLQKGRKSTEGQALAAKAGALDDRIEQVLHAGKAFSHRTPTLTCVVIVRR